MEEPRARPYGLQPEMHPRDDYGHDGFEDAWAAHEEEEELAAAADAQIRKREGIEPVLSDEMEEAIPGMGEEIAENSELEVMKKQWLRKQRLHDWAAEQELQQEAAKPWLEQQVDPTPVDSDHVDDEEEDDDSFFSLRRI